MLSELRFGQEVAIWPARGLRVVMGPGGPDLPAEGAIATWSEWWYARHAEGAIHLHDPRPAEPLKGGPHPPLILEDGQPPSVLVEGLEEEAAGPPGIEPAAIESTKPTTRS